MNADNGRRICGAKNRAGTPCQRAPMPNGRCSKHGGKSLSGPAHPSYKNGRYSDVLPTRMRQAYEASLNDADLLSVRELLAVHLARYRDLLARVDTGESTRFYDKLKEQADAYEEATDDAGREVAWRALRSTLYAGYRDWQTWQDVERTVATVVRLADYEKKRLLDMQAILTVDEVMATLGLLLAAIEEQVDDPRQLQAIQNAMMAGLETRQQALVGGGRQRK